MSSQEDPKSVADTVCMVVATLGVLAAVAGGSLSLIWFNWRVALTAVVVGVAVALGAMVVAAGYERHQR